MDLGLKGHRVIVTGAASGIGLAVAKTFQAEGAEVRICDVNSDAIAASGFKGKVCDVSDAKASEKFIDDMVADLGGLDTLVNNAGIAGPTSPVEEVSPDDWNQTLGVCLSGQFHMTRAAVASLRGSENPSIINLSSLAGRVGFALRTPYAAAKWGVIGFTKSLAIELGSNGIRVNAILPGLVEGERQTRVLQAKSQRLGISFKETEERAFGYTSIKEYVSADQIADQIVFLASKRGKTISGQAISICGDTQMLA